MPCEKTMRVALLFRSRLEHFWLPLCTILQLKRAGSCFGVWQLLRIVRNATTY